MRALVGFESVDCVVRKARLKHAARLTSRSLPQLNILLQAKGQNGSCMPYVELVLNDLDVLRASVAPRLDSLGDPRVNHSDWSNLMYKFPNEWKNIVNLYTCLNDDHTLTPEDKSGFVLASRSFACDMCSESFRSNKACLQHKRAKHNVLSVPAMCLGDTNTCPI